MQEVKEELREGSSFEDPDLAILEAALTTDPDALTIEASLTAKARGAEQAVSSGPVAGSRPAPRLQFAAEALNGSLIAWGKNVADSITFLALCSDPIRRTVLKPYLSLVAFKTETKSKSDVRSAESREPAADLVTSHWIHWDRFSTFEGRLTELDKDGGIVYRLFLCRALKDQLLLFSSSRLRLC